MAGAVFDAFQEPDQVHPHAFLSEHFQDIENFLGRQLRTAGGFADSSHVEVGMLLAGSSAHVEAF